MTDFNIRKKCSINTNSEADTFVGIKSDSDGLSVHFPLGFHLSENDKDLRKDILLLVGSIASSTGRKDSEIYENEKEYNQTAFPFHAYLFIIYDYFARGYYKEREITYTDALHGKINWGRTIKNHQAYIQDNDVFYLDFDVKKNSIKEDEMITLIHEFFVYDSFEKIGWLFTNFIPKKPRLSYNARLFKSVIKSKLLHTYNDKNKQLFQKMLDIIDYQGDDNPSPIYRYGTYRFEYVWEAMIDKVYGVPGKDAYFPKTVWKINGKAHDNACLEPDTIMVWNNDVYVLDAKYYKYGATGNPKDLPESSSINKQITYGEYISETEKFRKIHGVNMTVYNAFLMPYDGSIDGSTGQVLQYVGEAEGDWKDNSKLYHRIQGILVDVKTLMSISTSQDESEIQKLSELISANL